MSHQIVTTNQTLKEFESTAWQCLDDAKNQPENALRWPILGYVGQNGEVQQRSVVLRDVNQIKQRLTFFTDYRSDKVQAIRDSNCSLLFVDRFVGLQIAMTGQVHLAPPGSPRAQDCAKSLTPRQWLDYATITAPGTKVTNPAQADLRDQSHASTNFCVVDLAVTSADIVRLGQPTLRAKTGYTVGVEGPTKAEWITP